MKQYEAVIKVMEDKGGYATLGSLNQNVLKVEGCDWKRSEERRVGKECRL